MIGIVVAIRNEAKAIFAHLPNNQTKPTPLGDICTFNLCGKDFVMLIGGVGKVASAIATQYLIDKYSVTSIFNFGTCGGVEGEVELGKVYCIDRAVQYDFDLSEVDDCPKGTVYRFDTPFIPLTVLSKVAEIFPCRGLATADQFTNSNEIVKFVKENFDCPLRDMEGAAVAQTCVFNKIPCIMIKGVSDYVGDKSISMYKVYAAKAVESIQNHLLDILQLL